MKERLAKLLKEAQERYIYAQEQAQYLIDNWVECVKHGEWVDKRKEDCCDGEEPFVIGMVEGCPYASCFCSECEEWLVASDEYDVKGNYCPNCGAKMKGGEG